MLVYANPDSDPTITESYTRVDEIGGVNTGVNDILRSKQQETIFEPSSQFTPAQPVTPVRSNSERVQQVVLMAYPELGQVNQLEDEALQPSEFILRIQPLLDSVDPVIRLRVLDSVTELNHMDTLPILINGLSDTEPLVRIAMVESLALQGGESASAYIEPLLFDADKEVRIAAIRALAELQSESMIPALASLLYDQDAAIRNSAVAALGEYSGSSTSQYIVLLESDPDDHVRANVNSILREQGMVNLD